MNSINSKEKNHIAIYWDYENVQVSNLGDQTNIPSVESILDFAKEYGLVKYQNIYSNWSTENKALKMSLYSLGFELIIVPMSKSNSCDLKIAADIANDIYSDNMITDVILITGDKDFIPIITWLKKIGKNVVLIGQPDITSDHLILSADEYIPFTSFTAKESIWQGTYKEAKILLLELLKELTEQLRSTRFSFVKAMMKDKAKGFDEKEITNRQYQKFQEFIFEVEKDKAIQINGSGGFLEMFLPEVNSVTESEFAEVISQPTLEHWELFFDRIELCFKDGKGKKTEGTEYILLAYLKTLREEEKLPLTKNQIRDMFSSIIDIGLLVELKKKQYKMSVNYQELKNIFFGQFREN